jgi:hypothetical protein
MKTKPTRDKAGRKKFSAGGLFNPANTFNRNLGVALFGKAMLQEDKLLLVGCFEKVGSYDAAQRKVSLPFCERKFDQIARPLLLDALLRQDPQPFLDYAAAIQAAQRIQNEGQPIQPFHAKILRFANILDLQFSPGKTISFTAEQLKVKLKLPQSVEYIRRECKALGVGLLPGKVGRPRKSPTISARRKS